MYGTLCTLLNQSIAIIEKIATILLPHPVHKYCLDNFDFIFKMLSFRYGEKLHWFVPSGSKSWFSDRGISEDNIHDMVWWQSATIPTVGGQPQDNSSDNVTKVVFTPGNHFSRRGLFDGYKALWGSWAILGSKGHKFWFGGDTAYSDVFKQIGERYGPFDLSAIPIGAYNPR